MRDATNLMRITRLGFFMVNVKGSEQRHVVYRDGHGQFWYKPAGIRRRLERREGVFYDAAAS